MAEDDNGLGMLKLPVSGEGQINLPTSTTLPSQSGAGFSYTPTITPPSSTTPPPSGSGNVSNPTDTGGWESGYENNTNGYESPISSEIYALAKEQIAYTSRRLEEIQEARRLADMTGSLTSEEKKMFDEMESSAVANLKSQVNKQTEEVWDTAIADLVNRGVLQGTVGSTILGEIGSESLQMIAEGVNTIRGEKNAQMLTTIEGNKNRALTWQQMLTQESLGLLGVGSNYAGMQSNENIASENRALQNALGELSAKVNLAGIASAENIAAANRTLTETIASWENRLKEGQLALGYGTLGR